MHLFDLTSRSFQILMLCITVTCLAWAVFWVPRRPWKGWHKYVQQSLAVVLSSSLAVFLAFVSVNRASSWYSSWSDLFGLLSPDSTVQNFGRTHTPSEESPTTFASPSVAPTSRFSQVQKNPLSNAEFPGLDASAQGGQWIEAVVPGQGDRGDATVFVWFPQSYLEQPERSYSVIFAFAGVPGSPRGFQSPLQSDVALREAVAAGKIRDSIIVAPNVFPKDLDTECINQPGAAVETWVVDKVVPWVKSNLRVDEDPKAWTTFGYSAGAWCANMFTLRYPSLFATSISMSGYYSPVFPDGRAIPEGYDLGVLAATEAPPVTIWNYSGKGDGKFRTSFDKFSQKVTSPTSLVSTVIEGSSHRWPVWTEAQNEAFQWLGSTNPSFAAGAGGS